MRFLLRDSRLAFPNIWKPYKESFGARLIIPTNHKQIAEFKAAMSAVAKEKWPDKHLAIYKALDAADKLALHNGDSKSEYEGFEGNLFVAANSKVRPTVYGPNREDVTEAEGLIYSGCYVNASLELWAQDNADYGKRINAQLRGVQFLRKGDAFSGAGTAADADEFDEINAPDESGEPDLTA